jgi:CxxC motif-containing protein (DUF1111 family)
VVLIAAGCDGFLDPFPDTPADNTILDGPVEGLTPDQLAIHLIGDEEFGRRFSPSDGAAPLFVATSCDACHPGEGKGHPAFNLTRFGRMDGGVFDQMKELGGPQLQHRAVAGYPPENIPAGATGIAQFTAPAITGLGFLEAIDDATLLELADPNDDNGDGISGRVQMIDSTDFIAEIISIEALVAGDVSGRARFLPIEGKFIGRFGKKGLTINLLHQTVQAYIQDMGLTTDLVPQDLFNVQVGNFATDTAPDPEIPSNVVDAVVFYLKTLRPPQRRNSDDPDVLAGERLFEQIQCAACHVPTLTTGRSEIPQLSGVEVHPYTDLLLHDMGPELDDGYTEGIALTSEWRTPPLWGLGLAKTFQGGSAFYLHDGRASTLREVIDYHGGEASGAREAFRVLSEQEQEEVIAFLESL